MQIIIILNGQLRNYAHNKNQYSRNLYCKSITKNSIACEKTRTITILPSNNATISAIDIVDNSDNNMATVQLTNSSIGNYLYSIDAPNGPFYSSNHFENIKAGFHTIYVYDDRGCGTVSKEFSILKLPKFFTPNGDGRNDTWGHSGHESEILCQI